jgi:hypothetical protein
MSSTNCSHKSVLDGTRFVYAEKVDEFLQTKRQLEKLVGSQDVLDKALVGWKSFVFS